MAAQQPMARIDLTATRAGTKEFLAIWGFTAFTRWPQDRISYIVEHEVVFDDVDETAISTAAVAKVDILPDGIHISLPDGTETVDGSVTTETWRASEAGQAVLAGLDSIIGLVHGVLYP